MAYFDCTLTDDLFFTIEREQGGAIVSVGHAAATSTRQGRLKRVEEEDKDSE
jgi:predicted ABC-type transport system involved in lysophospholipase L1 biosynthesis ATPase subunit